VVTEVTGVLIDPQPVLIALLAQQVDELFCIENARRIPATVVHRPEVLGTAFGAAAIGEGDFIDLAHTLRVNAGHHRRLAIHGCQGIADLQIPHALPAGTGTHLGIQRLGFTHTGTTGDDDEVAGLQAGGHAVEVGKAGRHAGDFRGVLAVMQFLNALDHLREQRVDVHEALLVACAHFGNGEYFLFGGVEQFFGIAAERVKRIGGDFVTGHDEVAQDGALAHDLGITADVGGGWGVGRQLTEVGQTAGFVCQAGLFDGFGDGHHIGGFGAFEQTRDLLEDEFVFAAIEVGFGQQVGNAIQRFVVQQQATEHRLFGFDGVRRYAQLGNGRVDGLGLITEVAFAGRTGKF